jgi:hypothetical protein
MVAAAEPYVREPAAGSRLDVLGVTHIYKATAAETAGTFSLWEAVVPPGAGPPPHTHSREDEAFYVLSGEIAMEFDGASAPRRVGAGGFCFGARPPPRLSEHWPDAGAASDHERAEPRARRMFAELDAATVAGTTDIATIAAIAAKFGVTIDQ